MIPGLDYLLFVLLSGAFLAVLGARGLLGARGTRAWAAPVGAGAAVLVVGWFVTARAGERAMARVRDTVCGFAPTYARELEEMGHGAVGPGTAADDPAYLRMIGAQKRWLGANPSIADVYTFRRLGDGRVVLVVDSETDYDRDGVIAGEREGRTEIGEVYDQVSPALERAFAGEAGFDEVPVTDRWGTWVCAYCPIRDAGGGVEAVVGVDFHAGRWVEAAAQARLAVMGYLGALVILIGSGAAGLSMAVGAARERGRAVERLRLKGQELEEARRAADAANRAKSEFLANMSHEIRTPMTAILGYAEMLEEPDLSAAERGECAGTIRRNGRHLLALINDILDHSKIEAGAMTVERVECSAWEIVNEVVELLRGRAEEKGIALAARAAGPVPERVTTDPVRLKQILVNLVGNAVKFTATGRVDVELRAVPGDAGRPALEVAVRDTGIGIGPEAVGRLFRPFAQADGSTTRVFGGTGLGLSISRRLAELLGGGVRVSSTPGAGSEFVVRIDAGAGGNGVGGATDAGGERERGRAA